MSKFQKFSQNLNKISRNCCCMNAGNAKMCPQVARPAKFCLVPRGRCSWFQKTRSKSRHFPHNFDPFPPNRPLHPQIDSPSGGLQFLMELFRLKSATKGVKDGSKHRTDPCSRYLVEIGVNSAFSDEMVAISIFTFRSQFAKFTVKNCIRVEKLKKRCLSLKYQRLKSPIKIIEFIINIINVLKIFIRTD